MPRSIHRILGTSLLALSVPLLGSAHHSFAMFDSNRSVTLHGTVRAYEWTNPHTWLWVDVTEVDGKPVADKDGKPVVWGIEGTAPGEMARAGRTKNDVKPGDKVTLTVRPLKDGRPGASGGGRIKFDDGRSIGGEGPGPGAGPGGAPRAGGPPPGQGSYPENPAP